MAENVDRLILGTLEERKRAHQKRWAFLSKYLNRPSSIKLYDESIISQEFEPQPNWTLPEIDIDTIYRLPTFQFKSAQLFRFTSVNLPIFVDQFVYQIPFIKSEDVQWGIEHGYNDIHIGMIQFGINPLV